mmetsp:Transcript_46439/g.104671  ORF Transcript_46439/g.104671 Transcript_46439/m.104671 type:complete len:163 (-) Transcript_46439:521-1009(-)
MSSAISIGSTTIVTARSHQEASRTGRARTWRSTSRCTRKRGTVDLARSIALRPTLARVPLTLAIPAPEPPSPKSRGASSPPAVIKAIWLADQDGKPFHLQEHETIPRELAHEHGVQHGIDFECPAGVDSVTPYALLSMHGLWQGKRYTCTAPVEGELAKDEL